MSTAASVTTVRGAVHGTDDRANPAFIIVVVLAVMVVLTVVGLLMPNEV